MERTEVLKYLKFAQQKGYALEIKGIKENKSKIYVDNCGKDKLEGQFCGDNKQMSYYYKNIVACRFVRKTEQEEFEKSQYGEEIYGDKAEDIAKRIEQFKEYY